MPSYLLCVFLHTTSFPYHIPILFIFQDSHQMQAFLWTVPTVSRVRDQLVSLPKQNYSHVATKPLTPTAIFIPPPVQCLVTQSHLTLWNPMGYSPPDSSVHGDSPGKNTGVSCNVLLQGIFPTQGSNPGLLHCRWILYQLSHQGSPGILEWVAYPFSRGSS